MKKVEKVTPTLPKINHHANDAINTKCTELLYQMLCIYLLPHPTSVFTCGMNDRHQKKAP
eukprot:4777671-Ditylum_brightwellii.AAC.1